MAKFSKKQIAYIRKNYDGTNLLQLSKRLNIPLKVLSRIVDRLKTSEKITEKKYCPLTLEKVYRLTKTDYLIFAALFIVSLFTYVYTMTPGIAAGDCGELTCAVYFLGGAHSPGYPLYCVVGKLFMWLFVFIGRIVYRLTFLSAFGGAVTVSVSYLFFIKFLGRYHYKDKNDNLFFAKIPAAAASLFFIFSEELWAQSVIAEVYTVNSLFLPIMFLIALIFEERVSQNAHLLNLTDTNQFVWNRIIKVMYLFFFLFGVAVGDHHIILGYFVPFTLFFLYSYLKDKTFTRFIAASTIAYGFALVSVVYYKLPKSFHNIALVVIIFLLLYLLYKMFSEKPRLILAFVIAGVFLFLGLLIYAYMPIRSLANAPLDWGNTEKLENFINVISRKQYRGFAQNVPSIKVFLQQIYISYKWKLAQFTPYIYVFILLGLFRLYKLNKKWFYFTLSFVLYNDLAFTQFHNFKFTSRDLYFAKVFSIPSYMFNLFWIVNGLEFFLKLIEKYVIKDSLAKRKKVAVAISILMLSASYLPFRANVHENNVRHAWANDNYGRNILKTLEYKSILFTEGGDNQVFSLLYHNYVEYLRPDVNDPNVELSDISKRGIFDQKGNVFLLYGNMMRMSRQQLFESQVVNDYKMLSTPGRPVYYTWKDLRRQKEINKRYGENFEYRQMGILYKAITRGEIFTPPIDYWYYYDFAWKDYPDEALNWDYLSREIIANYCFQRGDNYMARYIKEYNFYGHYKLKDKKKARYHFDQYKKYEQLAYNKYRQSQKYGFDMTAIHFNLSLLLEQKIRFLHRENKIKEILEILDETITNFITAARLENDEGGNSVRAYNYTGRAFNKKAVYEPEKEVEYMTEALRYYKKALEISPANSEAQNGSRRAQAVINNPTEKVKQLEQNLRKNPRNEKLIFELVKIYIDRLEANRAVSLLEQSMKYLPNSVNVMFNLGNLYQQMKKYEKAIKIFNRLLRINPNPSWYYYLGENHDRLKQFEEAYRYFKIFLDISRKVKNQDRNFQGMLNKARQRVRQLAPIYEG